MVVSIDDIEVEEKTTNTMDIIRLILSWSLLWLIERQVRRTDIDENNGTAYFSRVETEKRQTDSTHDRCPQ
jgi:hypothetical protein